MRWEFAKSITWLPHNQHVLGLQGKGKKREGINTVKEEKHRAGRARQ